MTKLDQLQREAEMVVEVRSIDNDNQSVGLALTGLLAEKNVASDRFVRTRRIEAVGARKIDQLPGPTVSESQPTGMPLDGDARIIADFLARAGQRVEQRALAGIGAADDGD